MKKSIQFALACALLLACAAFKQEDNEPYRVLAPIVSGNLLLFPVVRTGGKSAPNPSSGNPFLTLDEGIKSGQVEVTEAGKAQGLVRNRDGRNVAHSPVFRGDQVNTLVLLNNSDKPLLLLAGEIVTGGKQDRVIAKDRIVPAGGEPIDLSVFCIEPGRWTESSAKFGAAASKSAAGFMVQPKVREQAMVSRNQQEVWNAVGSSISQLAAAPRAGTATLNVTVAQNQPQIEIDHSPSDAANQISTTSYAKAMQNSAVSAKVDEAAAPVMQSRDEVLATLRKENAVGVVVAVRGEIVWADLFASTDLLARYWTKLVRSYAAESLTDGETHTTATVADAQHFLNAPTGGSETSEGEVGIYRYREVKTEGTDTFALESLLPGTGYDVHISKLKLKKSVRSMPITIIR